MIYYDKVTKIYFDGAPPAVADVTLSVEPGEFVSIVGSDTHSASLVPEQGSIEKEELSEGDLLSAMDGSEQARRRRITRGGESFIVFTSRSVLALLHRILPSPSLVVIASASLMGAWGNSGVILSQILRGIGERLPDAPHASGEALAAALEHAVD